MNPEANFQPQTERFPSANPAVNASTRTCMDDLTDGVVLALPKIDSRAGEEFCRRVRETIAQTPDLIAANGPLAPVKAVLQEVETYSMAVGGEIRERKKAWRSLVETSVGALMASAEAEAESPIAVSLTRGVETLESAKD